MKHTILLLLTFALSLPALPTASANPGAASQTSLTLESALSQLDALVSNRPDILDGSEIQHAAATLSYVLQRDGIHTADSQFALGNAYFIADDLANTILHYKRGLSIDPTNPMLRSNLNHARSFVQPAISPDTMNPTTMSYLSAWNKYIDSWTLWMISFVSLCSFSAIISTRIIIKLRPISNIYSTTLFISGVIGSGLVLVNQFTTVSTSSAVIMDPQTSLYSGPSSKVYTPVYDAPLGVGTECNLIESRENWSKIELSNGQAGWVARDAFEFVNSEMY